MIGCIPLLPSYPNPKAFGAEKREGKAKRKHPTPLCSRFILFPVLREKSFESNQKLKLRNQHNRILITKQTVLITEGDYKLVELD